MARRLLIALAVAFSISLACTMWLSRAISRSRAVKTLQYATLTSDIDSGGTIRNEDVRMVAWPADHPVPGAFTRPENLAGRTALYRVVSGQPVTERQLSAPGSTVGLPARIPEGMRAVSLKSDEVVGVAGFLLPGSHVDVLATLRSPSQPAAITSTVLQDAEVIAAGQKIEPDPSGKATTVNVVTLLAAPADAERVVLASAQGTLHFVLRNGDDHARSDPQPADVATLGMPLEENHKPQVHAPATGHKAAATQVATTRYSVEVVRGDKVTTESF